VLLTDLDSTEGRVDRAWALPTEVNPSTLL